MSIPTKPRPTVPHVKPMRNTSVLIRVNAAAVGVLVIGVVGCGGKPAASTSSAPPSAAVASPTPTKTLSEADQVKAWWSNYGNSATSGLEHDFSKMSADGKNAAYSAVLTDCRQMQADIKSYQALPPIPDPQLQRQWSTALTDFGSASAGCLSGNSGMAQQVVSELGGAVTAMAQLTSGISKLYRG